MTVVAFWRSPCSTMKPSRWQSTELSEIYDSSTQLQGLKFMLGKVSCADNRKPVLQKT